MFASRKKIIRGRNSGRASSNFRTNVIRGIVSIIGTVLLLVIVYHSTRMSIVTIQEVIVEGGRTIPHEVIRGQAETLLAGSYIGLIPRRFVYAYPDEMIRDALMRIPHVSEVALEKIEGRKLKIIFDEHVSHALWCLKDAHNAPCYFLNSDGFGFAEAPVLNGGAFVRHYTEADRELRQKQVLAPEKLNDVDWFIEQLSRESGFRISSVFWRHNGDIELSVSGGGVFIVAGGKDIRTTYENLQAVLQSKEYAHIAPGNFKYIDVRFDKKIFVNEVLSEETSSSTTSTSTESMHE